MIVTWSKWMSQRATYLYEPPPRPAIWMCECICQPAKTIQAHRYHKDDKNEADNPRPCKRAVEFGCSIKVSIIVEEVPVPATLTSWPIAVRHWSNSLKNQTDSMEIEFSKISWGGAQSWPIEPPPLNPLRLCPQQLGLRNWFGVLCVLIHPLSPPIFYLTSTWKRVPPKVSTQIDAPAYQGVNMSNEYPSDG